MAVVGRRHSTWQLNVGKTNRRLRKPSSYARLLSRIAVWDVAWGGLSPLAAFLLRDATIYAPSVVTAYCGTSFLASLLVFQWFQTGSPLSRFYSIRDALELLKACALVAALSAVIMFLISRLEEAPRSIPILHFLTLVSGLLAARIIARLSAAQREEASPFPSPAAQNVLVVQASRLAWFFSKMVEELAPGSFQIVAILDEQPNMKHRSLNGYPIIGAPADLDKVVDDYATHGVRIDQVVLAARPKELAGGTWEEISRVCRERHIEVDVLPERLMATQASNDSVTGFEEPASAEFLIDARADRPPWLDRPYWSVKRGLDLAITLAVAVLTSPIGSIVAVLVLLDVGIPIVFWQQRVGRNGAPLYLYKFRTLPAPFDRRTKERRQAHIPSPVGRFLRTTRLDEWPQIWNILSGGMSIVGPRPLLSADQPADPALRLSVRPGLTGWAQICGGKLVSLEEKTALDEWYIRHASLALDTIIALRTIPVLLGSDRRDENAIAAALRERSSQRRSVPDTGNGRAVNTVRGQTAFESAMTSPSADLISSDEREHSKNY